MGYFLGEGFSSFLMNGCSNEFLFDGVMEVVHFIGVKFGLFDGFCGGLLLDIFN